MTTPTPKTMTASPSTHSLPPKRSSSPPGIAAANPTTPLISDSFELASTRPSCERTTVGTSADLATW